MSARRALVADLVPTSCVDGPGNRFVVFLQGCNLDCLACHNPHTISPLPGTGTRWMDVDGLVAEIRAVAPLLSGVTVSGGEATVQWPVVADLFATLAADPELARLTRFVDSNGQAGTAVWDALAPTMDAAMVDLKAIDPHVHRFLTGWGNDRVLRSIEHLAGLGKLHEVRLLVVPGVNDRAADLAATARFLADIDPRMRIRVLGFRHHGARAVAREFAEAGPDDLHRAAALLVAHGAHPDRVTTWPPAPASTSSAHT